MQRYYVRKGWTEDTLIACYEVRRRNAGTGNREVVARFPQHMVPSAAGDGPRLERSKATRARAVQTAERLDAGGADRKRTLRRIETAQGKGREG